LVGDAAGNQKVALNRAIGRSQGEFARIGVRRCRRNYQVAEGALVCRIAVMVNMKRHSHRGRQYRNDQDDRKDNPPDSIPINHEEKQLALDCGERGSHAYVKRASLYVLAAMVG
jgi:hypothetical protein